MTEGDAFVVRQPIPGMPDDLSNAVWDMHELDAEIIIRNWDEIGDKGRSAYCAYLSLAWTRRGRRKRCQLAAQQLLTPYDGLSLPPQATGS